MIKKYWIEALLISSWVTAILSIRANISPEHDSPGYIYGAQCFLQEGFSCITGREPGYRLFLSLLTLVGSNLLSIVPLVQNILFLVALVYYVHSLFSSGRLSKRLVFRTSFLIALIPTFLIVANGAIYTESISASLTLIQLSLVVRFIRNFVLAEKEPGVAEINAWSSLLAISAIAGGSFLIKGTFFYVQIFFGLCLLTILLFWKTNQISNIRLMPSIWITACLIGSPLICYYGWSLMHPPNSADGLFGRGGKILYGRTEYAKSFDFNTETLPYLANALSESGCKMAFGNQCKQYVWQQEYYGRNSTGWNMYRLDDYYTRVTKPTLTEGEYLWLGKQNLVNRPFLQMGFAFYELAHFVLHHTTTGFASLKLPVIEALVTSIWFVFALKIANLAMYVGLFWLIRWREIKSKPEIIIPILFVIAYLLPYGFVTTVVRHIYPVAPLLVLVLADLGIQRWHTVRQLP